jgi:methylmalonyl-CoA/ethylmalonyl-CoA epimerase
VILEKVAENVLDHIAIAVPKIEPVLEQYSKLFGAEITSPKIVSEQGIRMAYIHFQNVKIELIEPLNEQSPIAKFLERNPKGAMHHFCAVTTDAEESSKKIKNNKMRVLGEPSEGHHGQKMFFMHPSDTSSILVEIVENKNGKGIKYEN